MNRTDLAWTASLAASRVIREQGVSTLPVDPLAIAKSVGKTAQIVEGGLPGTGLEMRNCGGLQTGAFGEPVLAEFPLRAGDPEAFWKHFSRAT